MNKPATFTFAVLNLIFGNSTGKYAARGPRGPHSERLARRNAELAAVREDEFEALVDAELMEVTDHWCGRIYSPKRVGARAEAQA